MGYFKQMFKKYDKVNGVVKENVGAIRVVKAFVREDYEDQKFSDAAGELFQNSISAERIISFNMPIMQLTVYSCILLISWIGATAHRQLRRHRLHHRRPDEPAHLLS